MKQIEEIVKSLEEWQKEDGLKSVVISFSASMA